jgi:hypothetical protein
VDRIHATYGAAAAVIAADAAPSQGPALNSESTDPYEVANECNSLASPSQAAAAASIGPAPGPVYIFPELISGDNNAKSIAPNLLIDSCLVSSLASGYTAERIPRPFVRPSLHERSLRP